MESDSETQIEEYEHQVYYAKYDPSDTDEEKSLAEDIEDDLYPYEIEEYGDIDDETIMEEYLKRKKLKEVLLPSDALSNEEFSNQISDQLKKWKTQNLLLQRPHPPPPTRQPSPCLCHQN